MKEGYVGLFQTKHSNAILFFSLTLLIICVDISHLLSVVNAWH